MLSWLFLICAVVGGTVLICQFVLTLVGLGGDHGLDISHDMPGDFTGDVGHDVHVGGATAPIVLVMTPHGHHGSSWLFAVISFRTLVAAATFFGLVGLAAQSAGQPSACNLFLAGRGRLRRNVWRTLDRP